MLINLDFLNNNKLFRFLEPNLNFRLNQIENINDALEGIQKFGPFDYNNNERNFDRIHLILIAPNESKIINNALKLLEHLNNRVGRYYDGFSEFFRLDEVIYPTIQDEIIKYTPNTQDMIGNKLLDDYPLSEKPRNLKYVVIVIGNDYKSLKNTTNYYHFKELCLKLGYPVQYISNYNNPDVSYHGLLQKINEINELPYALWNLCVGIYTKAGGIPWILKNPNKVDISIGIRFAKDQSKKFTFGFVAVFDKFGVYKGFYSEKFHNEDYNDLNSESIPHSKGQTIPKIWINKLIKNSISYFKDYIGNEVKKIAIQKLGRYGREEKEGFIKVFQESNILKYCLIEIFSRNILRIYIKTNKKYNVDRGICFPFANDWGILCTTGDYEYQRLNRRRYQSHYLGTPQPLIIHLKNNNSCYSNLVSACQDLFTLTSLHYQTVTHNEIRLPAPLLFSHKIAKFYAQNIKPHDNLKTIPWFV
ncbi:MAG: Piwi domain-containing protein [Candidatus Helarchaeota archaeon]